MKKKLLLNLLGIAFGIFFLWLAFRNVSLKEVVEEIKSIRSVYLPLALFLGFLSFFIRATRWGTILKQIKEVRYTSLYSINAVGFLFIHILPFRLGEVIKPYLLKKRWGVSFSAGFATVAIERVFDGLALVIFLIFGFIFANFKTKTIPYIGLSTTYLLTAGILTFGLALVFLLMLVYAEELTIKIIFKVTSILPDRLRDRSTDIARKFVSGLSSLPSLRSNFSILIQSIMIWLCSVAIMYLCFLAFNLELPWEASFVALGIVSLGIMLPAPPGFIGNFQIFCQGSLALYGVSAATGLSYSIVVHAINLAIVFSLGLICLPPNLEALVAYNKEVKEEGKEKPKQILSE